MRYSYRSNGIISRPISDHVGESVSSRSNQPLDKFWYKCLQTQRISDVNYGSPESQQLLKENGWSLTRYDDQGRFNPASL